MNHVAAIIVAGGSGSRMGSKIKKQYLKIQDKEILAHTVECFNAMPEIHQIIVVTAKEDIEYVDTLLKKTYHLNKVKDIVEGGKERQDSVYEGIKCISDEVKYVIVHDGARPLITKEVILKALNKAYEHKASIVAVPVKDTIKVVNSNKEVEDTPRRETLWSVQTPQIFEKELIIEAYTQAKMQGIAATDDSMLVEALGVSVYVVEGEYTNIKITTPEDLIMAENILK